MLDIGSPTLILEPMEVRVMEVRMSILQLFNLNFNILFHTHIGIFQLSRFGKKLVSKTLPIPPPKYLSKTQVQIPHFFVADAAFPLGTNLMRPYPGELLPVK